MPLSGGASPYINETKRYGDGAAAHAEVIVDEVGYGAQPGSAPWLLGISVDELNRRFSIFSSGNPAWPEGLIHRGSLTFIIDMSALSESSREANLGGRQSRITSGVVASSFEK